MRLISYNVKDLMRPIERKRSDNYLILKEFLGSDEVCVKIEDYTHKNASGCAASLGSSIKRFYRGQIKVVLRGGDVYLVKPEAIK